MYSMMLAEKKQGYVTTSKLKPGLLVYLKDGSMQEVKQAGAAIKGILNQIVLFLRCNSMLLL